MKETEDTLKIYGNACRTRKPFIVEIEGTDGAGKETQARKLKEWFESSGKKVTLVSFPRYECSSSQMVKDYLGGKFGSDPSMINACNASMFFTMDRAISFMTEDWAKSFREEVPDSEVPDVIIFDRYVGSNMIHQASKLISDYRMEDDHYQKVVELLDINRFCNGLASIEYDWLGMPKADIVLFLDMPLWASEELRKGRANKINGQEEQDIHERNKSYLTKVDTAARFICNSRNWTLIPCTKGDTICTIDEIHEMIKNKF